MEKSQSIVWDGKEGKGGKIQALPFVTHSLALVCYDAGDLCVQYAGQTHWLCPGRIGRKKLITDNQRNPGDKVHGQVAFSGPMQVRWRTADGARHALELDLDRLFASKSVPHQEDPERIYQPMPFARGEPTLLLEVNGRMLNLYLDASIQLLPEPGYVQALQRRRRRFLAFRKVF